MSWLMITSTLLEYLIFYDIRSAMQHKPNLLDKAYQINVYTHSKIYPFLTIIQIMYSVHLYMYVHFPRLHLHLLDYNLLSSTNSVSASGWCLADKILPTRKSIRETSGSELLGVSEYIVRRTPNNQQS